MLDVIQDMQAKQYEVKDEEGTLCRLRINPYRTMDNRIEGVVLTVLEPGESSAVGRPRSAAARNSAKRKITKRGRQD